jgi:hypothetical protein
MCRVHLRTLTSKTSDDIERARDKLTQAAPYAVDKLEELMMTAESEPVQLKAATEILDRAGVRGGVEIETTLNIDLRPAADVIQERLARLTSGALSESLRLANQGTDIIDAELVEEPKKEEEEEEDRPATIDEELEERPAATINATEEK